MKPCELLSMMTPPPLAQRIRTQADQNAIDCVLAALIHPSVFGMGLGRTVQNMLGVSWKQIVRAIKCREALEKVRKGREDGGVGGHGG
jgi:hypothetical protein